ncbi:cytochrome P450 [Sphaerisporangium rufum]|uniref:Cytochrome P450 n=1 Tax=Sphaerisporangium rufum TaxID=1381558 RepID=A0A919QXQ6_9ACTN|nr:cytochrome P450 [Sphaerisporangium rufum]GII75902.1 cytochrome P450 [Sphaerisporangium rufum]
MSVVTGPRQATTIPYLRLAPGLVRDPLGTLVRHARHNSGRIVRLIGGSTPVYLFSHPDDVQHVLRDAWERYPRQGMFWRPLRPLLGEGILSDGPAWESARAILQPLFNARAVTAMTDGLARMIYERTGELESYARSGLPFDAGRELADVINDTVINLLFGGRLSREDGRRLAGSYDLAARSITGRLLLPNMPETVRLPGDRAMARAVADVDQVVLPLVADARRAPADATDVLSALCRARAQEGRPDLDRQLRDDVADLYGVAAETTVTTITWMWPLLDRHPEVTARLRAEAEEVVGDGPLRAAHLADLTYTRMVLQEVMRLFPAGWLFPRMAARAETVREVAVEAGAQVLISPYVTHRLDEFWERPLDFDPERFAPGREERRHRYAYYPFGGGPHQCIGRHLFDTAAPLVVAAIMSRFKPVLRHPGPYVAAPAGTLRPRRKVELMLVPSMRALSVAR